MARALWKGAISFSLVNVPVELHSAQKRAASLDLTMLDKRDLAPVGYKRVNKKGAEVIDLMAALKKSLAEKPKRHARKRRAA